MGTKKGTSVIKTFKAQGLKFVDFSGREFESISQMAKAWGMSPDTLYHRIYRGWCIEKALTEPIRGKDKC